GETAGNSKKAAAPSTPNPVTERIGAPPLCFVGRSAQRLPRFFALVGRQHATAGRRPPTTIMTGQSWFDGAPHKKCGIAAAESRIADRSWVRSRRRPRLTGASRRQRSPAATGPRRDGKGR